MQSPIVPTTALGAANRDEMSLNLNTHDWNYDKPYE